MGRTGFRGPGSMSEPPLSQSEKLAGTIVRLQVGTQGWQLADVGEARNALLIGHGGWIWDILHWEELALRKPLPTVSPRGPATLHMGRKC